MKRILFTLAVCLILCATFSGIVLASDISNAKYYGVIVATDNSTAASVVSTNISGLSTTEMIAQGWLNSSANNCAIRNSTGADVAFMPGNNSTNPWMMFVDSIGAYSQKNYTLYTDSATGGKLAIFGTFQVPNSSSVNVTTNGTISETTFLGNTASDLFSKTGAYNTSWNPTTSNVTAKIPGSVPVISSNSTGATSVVVSGVGVTMPSGIASGGELIVVIDVYAGALPTITAPAGWTQLFQDTYNTLNRLAAFYKSPITGTETTTNFTTDIPCAQSWECFYIDSNHYMGVPVCGVTATGNSANPDPPNLTTGWGSVTTMWLPVCGHQDGTITTTAAPTGYVGLRTSDDGTYTGIGTAEKYDTAASENPGTFTLAGITQWAANTIAVEGCLSPVSVATTQAEHAVGMSYVANIPTNTSFETGTTTPTGWSLNQGGTTATWGKDSVVYKYGSSSVNITSENGQWANVSQTISTPASYSGLTVTLGGWLKSSASSRIRLAIYDGVTETDSATCPADGNWHFISVTKTVTNPCGFLSINALNVIFGTPVSGWADGVIFIIGSSLPNQYYNLNLSIDGTVAPLGGVLDGNTAIPANSNNITFGSSATPYILSANVTKGGNPGGSWAYNYAATITDLTGNGNTGTPTFRTTSSNANVSATLTLFAPVTIPEAPPFTVGEGPDWYSGNVTMSGNFTTGNVTLNYPFKAVIDGLATATATPSQLPLTFISGFVILALSITVSAFMRNFGGGSAFVKAVILFAGFGACIAVRIYDFWMILFLAIFVITVLFASRERSSS